MSATTRSIGRNVFIYAETDRTTVLGGLVLTNGVTNANFYSMVDIVFLIREYVLLHEDNATISRDNHPLRPGKYYITTNGPIDVNNEPWLVRTISPQSGTRVAEFRDAVRERDRRCVITGQRVLQADDGVWRGFKAAHIFPLAYEGHWNANNYSRWITIPPATMSAGSINSVQNGMLLRAHIHVLFDSYDIAITPDDNHKAVFFVPDSYGIAGTYLDQQFRQDQQRPVDQLLRWHFRQAVLANMRGAGEPIFETDFPPGTDMMGAVLSGPKAAERMESELFSRMGLGSDDDIGDLEG